MWDRIGSPLRRMSREHLSYTLCISTVIVMIISTFVDTMLFFRSNAVLFEVTLVYPDFRVI